ncbi:MAG: glycosyltransferase [Akkermansia sp.]|nr:glycosyltransferase [Akkermansia sp.]
MAKVSVLMPIFKTPEVYLREAVESVLGQTFKDFEFLILNDSPANTELDTIIASYEDERIRYIRNEENIGIAASRNKLLELAQGEYIAVLDHDDIALPERLEKQAGYLDSHPEIGVVGCRVREVPSGKHVTYPEEDLDIRLGLMWGCVIPHTGAMIRRSVLQQSGVRYESIFSPSEDYALWCRLIPHTHFHNLQEELACYRKHAINTSICQSEQMKKTTFAVRAMVATANPMLYQMYLMCATHTETIRLFGVLPILKRVRCGIRERVYLFEFLLLYTRKSVIKMPPTGM